MPELMAGIGHGDGVCALGQAFSGEDFGPFRRGELVRIESELHRKPSVQLEQPGLATGVGATRAKKFAGSAA